MTRCLALILSFLAALTGHAAPFQFEISAPQSLAGGRAAGRLFLILSHTNNPEPRFLLGATGHDGPLAFARDFKDFGQTGSAIIDNAARGYPVSKLSEVPAGDYFVQSVFETNIDLRSPNAPGNFFSEMRLMHVDPARSSALKLALAWQVPPETLPADTPQLKFLKIQSALLTRFFGRPIFLRAGVVLPRDYEREPQRRYPLWVRIGGLNTRFTSVTNLMAEDTDFRDTWLADRTPRFILLQLDGAGPFGDPYQVNSANNGPFGDAVIQELIPAVESRFRAVAAPAGRVLSGTSTGGWVALALQIFYPDFFNGAWASCPDPVDFRALELVDIYGDENAYRDSHGLERPSARDLSGAVQLTMRQEVSMENLLGSGNSYICSGEQWGAWNAVFSPRGADGLPVPIWDAETGKIDRTVAAYWKRYDLRLILERDWPVLAGKLHGKIHIASGEADQYFLNSAVHLLEASFSRKTPLLAGRIVYGPGKPHGWSNLSVSQMLTEMRQATEVQ